VNKWNVYTRLLYLILNSRLKSLILKYCTRREREREKKKKRERNIGHQIKTSPDPYHFPEKTIDYSLSLSFSLSLSLSFSLFRFYSFIIFLSLFSLSLLTHARDDPARSHQVDLKVSFSSQSPRVWVCRLRKVIASLRKGKNCKPHGPSPNQPRCEDRGKSSARSIIARVVGCASRRYLRRSLAPQVSRRCAQVETKGRATAVTLVYPSGGATVTELLFGVLSFLKLLQLEGAM